MARRSRIRRVLKWAGLAVTLALLTVWVVAALINVTYHGFQLRLGCFSATEVMWLGDPNSRDRNDLTAPFLRGWTRYREPWHSPKYAAGMRWPRWTVEYRYAGMRSGGATYIGHSSTPPMRVSWPSYTPVKIDSLRVRTVTVPLWLPSLLAVSTSALLWWSDRRRRIPPGHCQKCGYNLTGNVSGRCPECGTVVKTEEQPA